MILINPYQVAVPLKDVEETKFELVEAELCPILLFEAFHFNHTLNKSFGDNLHEIKVHEA